jgi:tRNA nucleotidyltransferase (CCA-adding enzyme)
VPMQVLIPKSALAVVALLRQAGHEAYIVGGSVRDLLLERESHDWDFTTNAPPEAIQAVFPESFYENDFGTVGVTHQALEQQLTGQTLEEASDPDVLEITTYRSEGVYTDFRRPSEVHWGTTLQEDLQRRDFTMNAIAMDVEASTLNEFSLDTFPQWPELVRVEVALVDPYNGQADLKNSMLRCVGIASERFQEDALRMLRAVRLAAQLQLRIDQDVAIALQQHADLIQHVSWERIRDEFLKIIVTDHVETAVGLLYTTGLLKHILPELSEARGVDQRGHHEYDVWTHSLRACQFCPTEDPIVKFAALLHDIGKPETQAPLPDTPGEFSFHNHEVVGARTARDIARRFCLSKDDVQKVFTLVRWHMFTYQSDMTDAAIRRFIRRVGRENIEDIVALREGDRLGSGSKRTSWRLEELKQRIHEQLHQPMQINEMAVTGHDVMERLGVKPGPIIGTILGELFELVMDDPSVNTREILLPKLDAYRDKLTKLESSHASTEV